MKDDTSFRSGKRLFALSLVLACWQAQAALYPGNGNTGFGGALGTGSLTLTDNGTTVTGTFTRGLSGAHQDFLVMYIDSISGGLTSTIGINDTADDNRKSISGATGSFVNFAPGFESDFAISLYNNASTSGGLYTTVNGTTLGPAVDSVNLSGGGTMASSYTFDFDLSEIGLTPNNGDSFRFVVTYTSSEGFRSDEAIGAGVEPGNPLSSPITFTSFETYTSVPEPSSCLLLGLGALGTLFCLRRRA